ncbi:MAG: hypothetical protein AB7I42_25630 [Bradyrhizobium sp.]|uniref:hypothetical protein n=1 Tax=Bradyrhizobium sp. TaxID=376 RepID=UPI003D105A9B
MEQQLKVRIIAEKDGTFKAVVDSSSADITRLDQAAATAGRSIQQNFDRASDSTRTLQTEVRNARRDISTLLAIGELQKVTGEFVDLGNVVTAVFAGRIVNSLALYAKETVATVVAIAQQRQAALAAVAATTAHHRALAQQYTAAIAATGANTAYAASLRAQIAASNAAAVAARAHAASLTVIRGVMSFLGGPLGVITLGATALSFWALRAKEAKAETDSLAEANKGLAGTYLNPTRQGIASQIIKLEDEITLLRSRSTQPSAALDTRIYDIKSQIANLKDQLILLGQRERRLRDITSIGSETGQDRVSGTGRVKTGQTTAEWAAEQAIALQRQLAQEGARATESVRADYEVLQDDVTRYLGLLNTGAIDQEAFNRLIVASGQKFSGYSDRVGEFNKLLAEIDPAMANAQKYLADYDLLASKITDPARLEQARDTLIALRFGTSDVEKPAQQAAEAVAQIYEDTASSIRSAFRDTFRSVFDDGLSGFKDFGQRMLDVFKDMLADMLTLAIARPVIVPVVAGLGGLLGVSGAAQAGVISQLGGGLGVGSSLIGAGGFLGGLGAFGTALGGGVSAGLSGGFGAASTIFNGGATLGAGAAGWGATLGSFAGAALPWVAGAAILDSITGGGLFGTGWKTKDTGLELTVGGSDIDARQYENQKKKRSGFRGSRKRTVYSTADADLLDGINATLDAGIDSILAGAAGLGVGAAEQILEGFKSKTYLSLKGKSAEEAQAAVEEWLDKTFTEMARAVVKNSSFAGLLIDANSEMVKNLFGIGTYLGASPLADAAEITARAQMTLKQQYDEQRVSIEALIRSYDGGMAATKALATATQERYQMEIALLQQIGSIKLGVQDVLGGSIENIRQSVMSPQALYAYLTSQAQTLAGQIPGATDPTVIQDLVNRIDALTNQAYNLVPDGAQSVYAQQFIDFLTGVRTSAEGSLDAAAQAIQDRHGELAEAIKDSMEIASARLQAAADRQEAAAAAAEAAAKAIQDAMINYYRFSTR